MAAAVIELLGGADQADVAFLDQIQEGNAAAHVLLGDADHQARVGGDEVLARRPAVLDADLQSPPARGRDRTPRASASRAFGRARSAWPGETSSCGGEQRNPADFLEVQPDRVVGVDAGDQVVVELSVAAAVLFGQFVLVAPSSAFADARPGRSRPPPAARRRLPPAGRCRARRRGRSARMSSIVT